MQCCNIKGQRKGDKILTVYKISSVENSTDAHLSSPSFTLDLICYSNGGEFTSNVDSTFWSPEAPAWKAAMKRMCEKNAFVPAYVNDYKEFILDVATLNDLNDALSEQNFVNTIEVLPDLKTAYTVVGDQLGKEMLKLDKYECAQLIVYPYIPFAACAVIMKAEFPLNWRLLKSVANGVKFKGMYKKVVKDDSIIAIYKRKSDLGLKHVNEVCAFYNTDIKTLNQMASEPSILKEIQDIDNQIDKMMQSEED